LVDTLLYVEIAFATKYDDNAICCCVVCMILKTNTVLFPLPHEHETHHLPTIAILAGMSLNSKTLLPFEEDNASLLALLDALPMCISYIDTQLRYQFMNAAYLDWFHLERSSIIGKTLAEVIGLEAFDLVYTHIEKALSGQPVSYEALIPYTTCAEKHISAELIPAFSATGIVCGCYAVIQDISQRKMLEDEQRTKEKMWQFALESAGDGVWDWYPQTGLETLSKRLKEIYGLSEDDITDFSDDLDSRTHPEDLAQMRKDRQAHFDGITPIYINEHRVRCKDGHWKWILTRGTVIERDASGLPLRVVGTHTDISERKQAEAAVRQSEERLRMALSATHQGLYDLNVQTGEAIVTDEYTTMLGYEHANFHETNSAWRARLHPDDLSTTIEAYKNYIDGKAEEYRVEFRQRKKDGEWIWILSVGAIVEYDTNGLPLRMLGTHLDINEKKKAEALIWQQANIDTLTGLPNRRMFNNQLEHDLQISKRTGLPLAVLFIDLDHFKTINDTLGHAIGDALLIEAARRLKACVRESDTVSRLGGDEFTISLPELHGTEHVETIAENIIEKMAEPFMLDSEDVFLSASIGITIFPGEAETVPDLIRHADQAMYAAKAGGRNRFSYFTPTLQTAALARMRLTSELRIAIAEKKLQVYFQPIVDLHTGRIRKAEALIRWRHEERGFISPADFIPLAEASGLIAYIGDYVFTETVSWVQRWREKYIASFQISINQSPVEFQGDVHRYTKWITQLRQLELPGQAISVEITEGLLLDASEKIIEKLLLFREAGMQVSLDDFGTGYSSLSYLKKFNIDYLKIDQSFIRNLSTDKSDIALTEAIIVMAHKLGLKVIAEGVETIEQRETLRLAGCDYAQGYLFAKPIPPEEFEKLLQRQ
jgi:diguanylate cyclase (GGDEF)-like protein/PAS domain S-box-containing protein